MLETNTSHNPACSRVGLNWFFSCFYKNSGKAPVMSYVQTLFQILDKENWKENQDGYRIESHGVY